MLKFSFLYSSFFLQSAGSLNILNDSCSLSELTYMCVCFFNMFSFGCLNIHKVKIQVKYRICNAAIFMDSCLHWCLLGTCTHYVDILHDTNKKNCFILNKCVRWSSGLQIHIQVWVTTWIRGVLFRAMFVTLVNGSTKAVFVQSFSDWTLTFNTLTEACRVWGVALLFSVLYSLT